MDPIRLPLCPCSAWRSPARNAAATRISAWEVEGILAARYRNRMSGQRFTAVFERDEAGYIYAHVPELPEVQTQGDTIEEARDMVRAAIEQALELRRERGEPIPDAGWAATELVELS